MYLFLSNKQDQINIIEFYFNTMLMVLDILYIPNYSGSRVPMSDVVFIFAICSFLNCLSTMCKHICYEDNDLTITNLQCGRECQGQKSAEQVQGSKAR